MTELGSGIASVSTLTTVPGAFRAVVGEHPGRIALEADGASMTYVELDRLSNRIANGLLARGGEEPLAMVCPLEPTSIVVMLGALKAGRIFVPLDPRDPPERLARVRDQVGALLVSGNSLTEITVELDADPGCELDPYHPSLVYFTSGSGGAPKGTIRSHRQLTLATVAYDIGPGDRVAVIVPPSFAASVTPVFGTLLSGATACLFDPIGRGTRALADWIEQGGVTALQTSPSVLRTVAASLDEHGRVVTSLRLAIIGGEVCRGEDLATVRRVFPRASIANHYGSSEAGYIAVAVIEPDEDLPSGSIPFRRIFPWHVVEIVDKGGQSVAPGEAGEIVVRGSDVSLGYWAEPEEGGQRFFEENGLRSVRTGDRGRFLPDGRLEHLGRADLVVKIHGQTVDPQAVEHALRALPDVEEAVVSAVPGRDGDLRLVAHVQPSGTAWREARDLRLALRRELPPFMVPSAFLNVAAVPRNARGKIDREALRQAALGAATVEAAYAPPRGPHEQALAELAADVLGLEQVGAKDDLFELGLDSFSVIELLAAISERMGVDLMLGDIYEASTVEALARRIDRRTSSAARFVFPLFAGGSGTSLFLVPGIGGEGKYALRGLAHRLDRPTYSFTPRGFDRRALPNRTVERAAACFVTAMRAIQPSGPYLIGGLSSGGIVAHQMCHELQTAGEEVALLTLLDPVTSLPGYRNPAKRIAGEARRASPGTTAVARRLAFRGVLWIRRGAQLATAGIVRRPLARQRLIFMRLDARMARRYRPRPYDGPSIVLRTREWKKLDRIDLGGALLTGEKQQVDIPGNHITMLWEPHVATVAAAMQKALAAADPPTVSRDPVAE